MTTSIPHTEKIVDNEEPQFSGQERLIIAIYKSAIEDNDTKFFDSELAHYYATLIGIDKDVLRSEAYRAFKLGKSEFKPKTIIRSSGLYEHEFKMCDFILEYNQKHGYGPTLKEISKFLSISTRTLWDWIQKLTEGRYLTGTRLIPRSLQTTEKYSEISRKTVLPYITVSAQKLYNIIRQLNDRGGPYYSMPKLLKAAKVEKTRNNMVIYWRALRELEIKGILAFRLYPRSKEPYVLLIK